MRFVCNELWGFPSIAGGNYSQPPGVTVTVHDSAMLYAVAGTFRSEDVWQGHGRDGMVSRARVAAASLAARLEVECDAA